MIKKFNEFINEDFTDLYKRWKNKEVRKEDKDNTNYVDLGLPSGTLWADRNLGATDINDCGLYYQFGITDGLDYKEILKFTYEDRYEKRIDGNVNIISEDGNLLDEYDAVYKATHGKAKMATSEQIMALVTNTETEIDFEKEKIILKSKNNGKCLYFPFNAIYYHGTNRNYGNSICILSKTLHKGSCQVLLCMSARTVISTLNIGKCSGCNVRGVMNKK